MASIGADHGNSPTGITAETVLGFGTRAALAQPSLGGIGTIIEIRLQYWTSASPKKATRSRSSNIAEGDNWMTALSVVTTRLA